MMAKVRLDRRDVSQVRAGSLTGRTRLASLGGYLGALAVIALCTSFSMAGASLLQTAGFAVAFPFAVLVVTARLGVGPAVLAGAPSAPPPVCLGAPPRTAPLGPLPGMTWV